MRTPGQPEPEVATELCLDLSQLQNRFRELTDQPLSRQRLADTRELISDIQAASGKNLELRVRLFHALDLLEDGQTTHALAQLSWVLKQLPPTQDNLEPTDAQLLARALVWTPSLVARNPNADKATVNSLLELALPKADNTFEYQSVLHQVHLALGMRREARQSMPVANLDDLDAFEQRVGQAGTEDNCPLHQARPAIAWLAATGNHTAALQAAKQAQDLADRLNHECTHPADLQSILMTAWAWNGQADAAWQAHAQSLAFQNRSTRYLADIGTHLRFCAATWSIPAGLEILEIAAPWFSEPEDPWDLMAGARGAALLLQRVCQERGALGKTASTLGFLIPGNNPWQPFDDLADVEVSHAVSVLTGLTTALAQRFDVRNINSVVTVRNHTILNEAPICPLVQVLDLLRIRDLYQNAVEKVGTSLRYPSWVLPFSAQNWFGKEGLDVKVPAARREPATTSLSSPNDLLRQCRELLEGCSIPPGISRQVEEAWWWLAATSVEAGQNNWAETVYCARESAARWAKLDDSRHVLTSLCYLMQGQWQLGDWQGARQSLLEADCLADSSACRRTAALLEELTIVAG